MVRRLRGPAVPLVLCLVAVAVIQAFFLTGGSWKLPNTRDYYGNYFALLAEGFLSGHLHLNVEPAPQLVTDPDPYTIPRLDALQAQGVLILHDVSLYKGHYYLYWGPVTALLHAAWQLVTGRRLPASLAELLAGLAIFLAFSFLGHRVRARHCPKAPSVLVWACSIAVAAGGIMPYMLSRTVVYHEAILVGIAFLALAWCSLLLAWEDSQPRYLFFALGGALMACAIGARITMLGYAASTGAAILGFGLLSRRGPGKLARDVVSYGAPILIAGLLLGAYNVARFGSFFEFGNRYQLGMPIPIGFGSANHVLRDLVLYLLAVPRLGKGYPWFNMVGPIVPHNLPAGAPEPAGLPFIFPPQSFVEQELIEPPLISPFLLAPVAFFSFALGAIRRTPLALRALLLSILLGVPIVLMLMQFVDLIVIRYYTDIALPLTVAGSLILIYCAHAWYVRRGSGRIPVAAGLLVCAMSIGVGFMLGLAAWSYSFPDGARTVQIASYQVVHRLGVPDRPPVRTMPPDAKVAGYAESVGISVTCAKAYLTSHDYQYPRSPADLAGFKASAPPGALCG